jgi:hypothetical protein
MKHEGRDATKASALLSELQRREHRCARFLKMASGWSRRHGHAKLPQKLRGGVARKAKAIVAPKVTKTERWDQEVRSFLDRQYPDAPYYKASFVALWERYLSLKLPTAHFVSELTSGRKNVVFQRAWEMMLARHLDARGFAITTADDAPDFRFEHEGKIYWVERAKVD